MENEGKNVNIEDFESIDIEQYPITTNAFTWTPTAIFLYSLLHILSFMMPSVLILTFYTSAMDGTFSNWWRILIIIVDVMAWWGIYILSSLLFGKLFLLILQLIHKPREGLFRIDKKDKDYYFYCLRIAIKKFIFWTWNNFAFPWASNLAFKMCDMRADFKSTMFDGWSDVEFIDYGESIMLGQGAVVLSSMIIADHLLIKKVIIGDHVIIGGNAIVAPGTVIGKGTTLGVWATTHIGQILEPDWIYIGNPARKYQPTQMMVEESKKVTLRRIVDTGEKIPYDVEKFIRREKKHGLKYKK
ncbi:MAG: acyltransferase [Candidatus Hodarchaeota archaeon]